MKTEFGLLVTSNVSLSHITFDDTDTSYCGLKHRLANTRHPNSEVRWYMEEDEFKKWISSNRKLLEPGYRLCKKCLAAYDKKQNHK